MKEYKPYEELSFEDKKNYILKHVYANEDVLNRKINKIQDIMKKYTSELNAMWDSIVFEHTGYSSLEEMYLYSMGVLSEKDFPFEEG